MIKQFFNFSECILNLKSSSSLINLTLAKISDSIWPKDFDEEEGFDSCTVMFQNPVQVNCNITKGHALDICLERK